MLNLNKVKALVFGVLDIDVNIDKQAQTVSFTTPSEQKIVIKVTPTATHKAFSNDTVISSIELHSLDALYDCLYYDIH